MNERLNLLLADLVVERHKLQSFHWYAKGQDFFQIHAKMEELYTGIDTLVDEVAELILIEGGKPLASLGAFLKTASIEEAKDEFLSSSAIVPTVLSDFEALIGNAQAVKTAADEAGKPLVSAKMDAILESLSLSAWMMRQQQMA